MLSTMPIIGNPSSLANVTAFLTTICETQRGKGRYYHTVHLWQKLSNTQHAYDMSVTIFKNLNKGHMIDVVEKMRKFYIAVSIFSLSIKKLGD